MKLFPEIITEKKTDEDVVADVHQSLVRLLNTRARNTITDFLENKYRSILSYGLPDFSHLEMTSETSQQIILSCIRKSINDYEYRFKLIAIKISLNAGANVGLYVELMGFVSCEKRRVHRKINFTIEIIRS